MFWVPAFTFCFAATAIVDLAFALRGLSRTELFWPTVFCMSVGGLSAVLMAVVFLDFDASRALNVSLAAFGVVSFLSLFPAIRSMT